MVREKLALQAREGCCAAVQWHTPRNEFRGFPAHFDNLKVVSYASQVKKTAKPFLLLLNGGSSRLSGCYLQKRSSAHIWGTRETGSAMTFTSVNAATRYAQELRDKGWGANRIQQFVVVDTRNLTQTALAI